MEEPLRTGWLVKQGHVVKNWKRRYFVLDPDGKLSYYSQPEYEDVKPKGSIDISTMLRLEEDAKNKRGKGSAFNVVTSSRTLYLVASSKAEAALWITSIKELFTSLKA